MRKLFEKRSVAWIVLILSIAVSLMIGQLKNSGAASYNGSGYSKWIQDDAKLLSVSTEKKVCTYNEKWDKEYHAIIAVMTTTEVHRDNLPDYANNLGREMGLGENDIFLVMEKDGDWYLSCGNRVTQKMNDSIRGKFSSAMNTRFYAGNYNEAVEEVCKIADSFYHSKFGSRDTEFMGVILFLVVFIALWVFLDRLRYERYQKRYYTTGGIVPSIRYYPIFWGNRNVPLTHRSTGMPYASRNSRKDSPNMPKTHGQNHRGGPRGGIGGNYR